MSIQRCHSMKIHGDLLAMKFGHFSFIFYCQPKAMATAGLFLQRCRYQWPRAVIVMATHATLTQHWLETWNCCRSRPLTKIYPHPPTHPPLRNVKRPPTPPPSPAAEFRSRTLQLQVKQKRLTRIDSREYFIFRLLFIIFSKFHRTRTSDFNWQ